MGLYATIKKTGIFCPKCGREMTCQSKYLVLHYKKQNFYLGDCFQVVEMDKNFEGDGLCFCIGHPIMPSIKVKIIKGKLIPQTKNKERYAKKQNQKG